MTRGRGGWQAPAILELADSRRLSYRFRFRFRFQADRFLRGLPSEPRGTMFALVHRSTVVSVRLEP